MLLDKPVDITSPEVSLQVAPASEMNIETVKVPRASVGTLAEALCYAA